MPAVLLVAKHLTYKLGLFNPASPVSWWAIAKSVRQDRFAFSSSHKAWAVGQLPSQPNLP